MALLEGIRIRNYRALRDIQMGRLSKDWEDNVLPLTPLVAVIGKNGAGKSSLFDAFGFLADCLAVGVEEACDLKDRGGFQRLRSAGSTEPIQFELYFRPTPNGLPTTYELSIDLDDAGRPGVAHEALRQRRKGMEDKGRPLAFLLLDWGKGKAWKGAKAGEEDDTKDRISVRLNDYRRLGIATLGALKEHPRIAAFRNFIASWYLSYFTPDAARGLPKIGPQKHLNLHGDNLANVVQFMQREHKAAFRGILTTVASKIPGLIKIDTKPSEDDRLLLRFYQEGFKKPFYAQQMSDGTLKIFAYLMLLEDPEPPAFLCIEEPENGLYHKLLELLATEFRDHATKKRHSSQLFVTTHQPYFVNALSPDEVWVLDKDDTGFSNIRRASDDETVRAMVDQGLPLGGLWYSDYLDSWER